MIVKKRILKRIIKEELNRFLTESVYTVASGDSLSKIASRYGISLDILLGANAQFDRDLLGSQGARPGPNDIQGNTGRNPNWIYPGEVIQIPGSTEGGPSSARSSGGPIPGLEMGSDWSESASSTAIPGLEMGSDWQDRAPPAQQPVSPSARPEATPSPRPEVSSEPRAQPRTPQPEPPQTVTIATPGSGPITVSGNNIEIDSRGRIDIDGSTYSLQADVMGGVALEVERIDASGSTVMITVDPAMGRTQTKPLRQYGLAQIRRGAGSSEFRVEPDPAGPDPSSPAIIFTRV